MRSLLATVALAALLVTAGCVGGNGGSETPTPTPTDAPTATPTPTAAPTATPSPTPTTTPTPTATPTPTVDPDNPYGKRTLSVAVVGSEERLDPVVSDALAYWEENSSTDAGYPITYRRTDDTGSADVLVEFVDSIDSCALTVDLDGGYIGCADYVTDDAPDQVHVEVARGYTTPSVRRGLIHELGHTLGLDHDEDAPSIMRSHLVAIKRNVTVQVRVSGEATETQVVHNIEEALTTWEDHLATQGHNVTHSVTVVDEFDGEAVIAYNATGREEACGDELVCAETDLFANATGVEVTTAYIRDRDHETVMGYYYAVAQGIPEDWPLVPEEFE